MDRLLAVNRKELRFNFEFGRKAVATLTLVNLMHTMPVAFKVSSTCPFRFCACPQIAVILPQGTACVEVTMRAQQDLPGNFPICSDKLYIKSMLVPTRKCTVKEIQKKFSLRRSPVFLDAAVKILYTGSLVLRILSTSDSLESLDEVISDTDVNAVDSEDRSALYMATLQGSPLIVKRLVEAGADVNMKTKLGETPLLEAACGGHVEIVQILLDAGANPQVRNSRGWNPVQAAAAWNHSDVLSVLLAAKADIDATDDAGKTALHYAVEAGHFSSVDLLLESGADKDRKCDRGWTALHWAAAKNRLDVAEMLIQRGANMNARDRKGRTPSTVALERGHHDLLDALRLRPILHKVAREGDTGTLTKCLLLGASVEHKDQNGWTALHVAAFKGEIEAVKLLLTHGAKLNEADDEGYTALHCAVEMGHKEVVALLLQHGADTKASRDCASRGKVVTAVELAVAMDRVSVAQLLENRRIPQNIPQTCSLQPLYKRRPSEYRRLIRPYASFPSTDSSSLPPTTLGAQLPNLCTTSRRCSYFLVQSRPPPRRRNERAAWL